MRRLALVLLLTFAFNFTAHAGDLPYAVIMDADADVFIGIIKEVSDTKISIEVSKALFENYEVVSIEMDKFLYGTNEEAYKTPAVGDYCAFAASYKNDKWEIYYNGALAGKADSLDEKTLNLYGKGSSFLNEMNMFINDGTYSFEKRKELMEIINQEKERNDVEADDRQIALETEIVTPLPEINEKPKAEPKGLFGFLNNNVLFRYVFITLLAALISYYFAKRQAKRFDKD